MIKVMTLDMGNAPSPERLMPHLASLRHSSVDLLCCQSIRHSLEGRGEHLLTGQLLSRTLGITCSCFAANRDQGTPSATGNKTVNGQATFTGSGVWVLNSGSFMVGEAGAEEAVQFALVRKNGVSLLALNLHLGEGQRAREQQFADLFAHPLLKDSYGAVVLCADRDAQLTSKQWQALTNRSNYGLQRNLLASGNGGLLCLLTARSEPVSIVTLRHSEPGFHQGNDEPLLPGLTMEFEVQRMISDRRNRPSFPLSFREQWLGYREHRAFA